MTRYATLVFLDETTDGDPIYVALHPELDGISGQGDTPQAALADLDLTREDYLTHMRDCKLDVPPPHVFESGDVIKVVIP